MTEPNAIPGFYFEVLQALEEIGAPYMIIGGFAAIAYGSTRLTFDIDVVVDLEEAHVQALAARFPPPRYYADPGQMRDSLRRGILFNLIDGELGQKVDLIPHNMEPYYRQALVRRIRLDFEDPTGARREVWFARPEDVVVGKLLAWAEARSRRHEEDILSMLAFHALTEDRPDSVGFDAERVDRAAAGLGPEVAALWRRLQEAARESVGRG